MDTAGQPPSASERSRSETPSPSRLSITVKLLRKPWEEGRPIVKVLDYSRSFITFVTEGRGNNARIQVEAQCRLTGSAETADYWLVASCKSENTYVEQNLFKTPNYDFCGIFSENKYRLHRVPLPYDPNVMDAGAIDERFEEVKFSLPRVEGTSCETAEAVVEATLDGKVLIGHTEISGRDSDSRAVIEYPIKTMNVHERPARFQVDTGPILLPDFASGAAPIEAFDLAFIAWNSRDWAEFVVQAAIDAYPGRPEGPKAAHYSQIRTFDADNEIFAYK